MKINKFKLKFNAILKNKADIYLLQDCRLKGATKAVKNELTLTKNGGYEIFSHSESNDRGIITFISNKLKTQVFNSYSSECDNVLILDIAINNFRLLLINTYGPTQTFNNKFFYQLKLKITELNIPFFILGGNLNAVGNSSRPLDDNGFVSNPDLFCMKGIPNIIHSRELTDWISSGFALDRFRTLYPHSREFSYLPFSKTALNRSRIDHYFISPNLCSTVSNVKYLPLSSSLFDHKPVLCVLGKKPNMGKSIDKSLLHITDLYEAVKFEVISTVIDYFNIPNKSLLRDNLIELNILNKQLYGVCFILNTSPHDLFFNLKKTCLIHRFLSYAILFLHWTIF